MKHSLFILGAAISTIFLTGCGTTTTEFDPSGPPTGIRVEGHISSEEMRLVAREAVRGAMTNPRFKKFLKEFEAENPNKTPILKLDKVVNNTDDPDLNVDEMTELLNTELINAGIVDVTMAEGVGRSNAVAASRDLEDDENFDQKTVAKRGTLKAARLVLRPKIISNTTTDGRKRVVVRTFVMDMGDIHSGTIMWKFNKQLGFVKEKAVIGW